MFKIRGTGASHNSSQPSKEDVRVRGVISYLLSRTMWGKDMSYYMGGDSPDRHFNSLSKGAYKWAVFQMTGDQERLKSTICDIYDYITGVRTKLPCWWESDPFLQCPNCGEPALRRLRVREKPMYGHLDLTTNQFTCGPDTYDFNLPCIACSGCSGVGRIKGTRHIEGRSQPMCAQCIRTYDAGFKTAEVGLQF